MLCVNINENYYYIEDTVNENKADIDYHYANRHSNDHRSNKHNKQKIDQRYLDKEFKGDDKQYTVNDFRERNKLSNDLKKIYNDKTDEMHKNRNKLKNKKHESVNLFDFDLL